MLQENATSKSEQMESDGCCWSGGLTSWAPHQALPGVRLMGASEPYEIVKETPFHRIETRG